jgi:hypothetical protein
VGTGEWAGVHPPGGLAGDDERETDSRRSPGASASGLARLYARAPSDGPLLNLQAPHIEAPSSALVTSPHIPIGMYRWNAISLRLAGLRSPIGHYGAISRWVPRLGLRYPGKKFLGFPGL